MLVTADVAHGQDRRLRGVFGAITAADVIVAAVVVATAAYWFHITRGTWFYVDEWSLALRGQAPGDFLQPYNGHLSITYIGIYRVLYGAFGFGHYGVFRLVGIAALALVPILLHVTTRARLGPALAGLAAISVLWIQGVSLEPGGMNHPLTLAVGVICAWCLRQQGRRSDVLLGVSLAVALATSGGGVPVAVACGVHTALSRARWQRWLSVAVPSAVWFVWWSIMVSGNRRIPPDMRVGAGQILRLIADGHVEALRSLGLGSSLMAGLLAAGFVTALVLRFRTEGVKAAPSVLAWLSASVVWWVGLAYSRGTLTDADIFRYHYVCVVYLLLALVPCDGQALRRATRGWWSPVALATITALLVASNHSSTESWAVRQRQFADVTRRQVTLALAKPPVLEPDRQLAFSLSLLTPAELTVAQQDYGGLATYQRGELDAALVNLDAVATSLRPADPTGSCDPLPGTVRARTSPGIRPDLTFRTPDRPIELLVRRFGDRPTNVRTLPPRSKVSIRFKEDPAATPWLVSADGACR